jgi:hypothetical protein
MSEARGGTTATNGGGWIHGNKLKGQTNDVYYYAVTN